MCARARVCVCVCVCVCVRSSASVFCLVLYCFALLCFSFCLWSSILSPTLWPHPELTRSHGSLAPCCCCCCCFCSVKSVHNYASGIQSTKIHIDYFYTLILNLARKIRFVSSKSMYMSVKNAMLLSTFSRESKSFLYNHVKP